MTTLPNPSNIRISFDDLTEFQAVTIPDAIQHVMVAASIYERRGGGDVTIADGSQWTAVTGNALNKTNDTLAAAMVLAKAGFPVTINGEGNINLTVGTGVDNDPDTTLTVNNLWINLEAAADNENSTRFRLTRTGDFTLRQLVDNRVQSLIDAGANRLQAKFEDENGAVSRVEVQDEGVVFLGTSSGTIMLRNGDDSGIALIPINSDQSEYILRVASDGQVTRMHPDATRNLGGPTAPQDGVTVAYYRHQEYLARDTGQKYYANIKSTNPDVSGAGSVWVPL